MPHGGTRNGWLFTLDDGRRMILTRCAVVDKPESQEFPMERGVIDAMATVSDHIAAGSIAHFFVDSGRTEMACRPGGFPHGGQSIVSQGNEKVLKLVSPETASL